jgi:hypothetical protein
MEAVAELMPIATPPLRAVVTAVRTAAPATLALVVDPRPPTHEAAPNVEEARRGADASDDNSCSAAGRPADLLDANSGSETRVSLSHAAPEPVPAPPPLPPPASVEPLTAQLRRLHLTVSKRFLEKLSQARDALSHSKPGATHEEILEAGLDLLLAADAKRKGIVSKPRKTPPPSSTDHIPAHVRRAVFLRDGGRCQVLIASGGICGSTYRVQLGHITARALGGGNTADDLRCECEVHNQRAADRDFGKPFMDRYRKKRRRTG